MRHHDCAGDPADEATQVTHIRGAIGFLSESYPGLEVIGLWVDEGWRVHEVPPAIQPDREVSRASSTRSGWGYVLSSGTPWGSTAPTPAKKK